ncbi:hypothetical protein BJV82DRAFT_664036 [Fennellomyces sp. T-0311]|nr:hypothetical protein BJV82DRAFT_664036 [Fennellomyces sp. T-0311]
MRNNNSNPTFNIVMWNPRQEQQEQQQQQPAEALPSSSISASAARAANRRWEDGHIEALIDAVSARYDTLISTIETRAKGAIWDQIEQKAVHIAQCTDAIEKEKEALRATIERARKRLKRNTTGNFDSPSESYASRDSRELVEIDEYTETSTTEDRRNMESSYVQCYEYDDYHDDYVNGNFDDNYGSFNENDNATDWIHDAEDREVITFDYAAREI